MDEEIFRRVARRRDHDRGEGICGGGEIEERRVRRIRVGWGEEPDLADLRVNDGAWSTARVHGDE